MPAIFVGFVSLFMTIFYSLYGELQIPIAYRTEIDVEGRLSPSGSNAAITTHDIVIVYP
jgi:hypothetical protein